MESKRFFYDFGRAIYHIDAFYEDFSKQSGVAPTLLWILYALNDDNAHTQREICADWELPKSTVNTVIMDLKKKDLVELTQIKGKRREMTVTLTESGKKYAEEVLSGLYEIEAAAFKKFTKEQLRIIQNLEGIVKILREMQETK